MRRPARWNLALLLYAGLAGSAHAAELAVVIDDLGYSLERGERVLALPAAVTMGLLPFAPATPAIAARARQTGHELILHQPMEPLPAPGVREVPGTLTVGMSAERFRAQMDAALAAVPGIVGLNNHTGSRLTQDPTAMRRLMVYLGQRQLLFLDSRTTPATVAYRLAREARVPAVQRDVFLDHLLDRTAMAAQFERALDIARSQGHAVLIAHPHASSLAFLEASLSSLPGDLRVVTLSHLVGRDRRAALARHGNPGAPHKSLGQ